MTPQEIALRHAADVLEAAGVIFVVLVVDPDTEADTPVLCAASVPPEAVQELFGALLGEPFTHLSTRARTHRA